MGMKIVVEIVLGYPDLSSQKHVEFLRHVFKDEDVRSVKLLDNGYGQEELVIPSYSELVEV